MKLKQVEATAEKRPARWFRVMRAFAVMVLLLAFYALSIGPAVWLTIRGYIDEDLMKAFYSPLKYVSDNCPPLHASLGYWIRFWLDLGR